MWGPSLKFGLKQQGIFFLEKLFSYQRVFPEVLRGFLASLHTGSVRESSDLPHLSFSRARILTVGRDEEFHLKNKTTVA